MDEVCQNCRNRLNLETWDYDLQKLHTGEWKTKEPGFCCVAFGDEGVAIHMLGIDPMFGRCEMFVPRENAT